MECKCISRITSNEINTEWDRRQKDMHTYYASKKVKKKTVVKHKTNKKYP